MHFFTAAKSGHSRSGLLANSSGDTAVGELNWPELSHQIGYNCSSWGWVWVQKTWGPGLGGEKPMIKGWGWEASGVLVGECPVSHIHPNKPYIHYPLMLWRGYSLNLKFRNTCHIPLQAFFQACEISCPKKNTHGNIHAFSRNGIKVKEERFRGAFGARTAGRALPFRWNVFWQNWWPPFYQGRLPEDDDMTPCF